MDNIEVTSGISGIAEQSANDTAATIGEDGRILEDEGAAVLGDLATCFFSALDEEAAVAEEMLF